MNENEKQLIKPKVLTDAFRRYMVEHNDREKCASEENCKTCERRCLWQRIVNDVPTVDAVEVVRCKDCKYLTGDGFCWEHIRGSVGYKVPRADDFCSYGERRTDV